MESLEQLKKKITGTQSLGSIVKSMKVLAAVNIRRYERALQLLNEYNETIEMGLQVVLRGEEIKEIRYNRIKPQALGAVIFGSDIGMCGQFNDHIILFTTDIFRSFGAQEIKTIVVGEKIVSRLEDIGYSPEQIIKYPVTFSTGNASVLYEILSQVDAWRIGGLVGKIVLLYNSPSQRASSYSPGVHTLFPLDSEYLGSIKKKEWKSRSLPVFHMDRQKLFASLMQSHLYASLYRSFLDSLTSENAARLASMQAAEKHITEHLEELTGQFNNERQNIITSELLDIIAGMEALSEKLPHPQPHSE